MGLASVTERSLPGQEEPGYRRQACGLSKAGSEIIGC